MKRLLFSCLCLFLLFSCSEEEIDEPLHFYELMEIPEGFPELVFPEGNEYAQARWELGKRLFFDQALSVDSSISCASCHHPALAFSDDVALSLGVEGRLGTSNSPSLANVGYQLNLLRGGSVPTLEMQVLVPIQEHNEFDFNIVLIADRLSADSSYVKLAQDAYERALDAFVITRAIATFERSLLSGNSPYDQHQFQGNIAALDPAELRGKELFFSEQVNCANCHGGFNFTNFEFENNGLYLEYADDGRFQVTGEETDRAVFKVPSLRNVELTAPYMHDGSLHSLEEVVEHYQRGGENHANKNDLIQPLNLSAQEKGDLVLFLKALTDQSFVSNPIFRE